MSTQIGIKPIDQLVDEGGPILDDWCCQVGVACGGLWRGVPQQLLNESQAGTRLQQVGGIGVAQGMSSDPFVDAALLCGCLDGRGHGTTTHRCGSSLQGLWVSTIRKKQSAVAVAAPVAAQCVQSTLWQQDEAILVALAVTDMDPHPPCIYISNLQVEGLTEAQSHTVDGQKVDLVLGLSDAVEQPGSLLGREDIGQTPGLGRSYNIDPDPLHGEHMLVEELQGTEIDLDGTPTVCLDQSTEILLEILNGQPVWRGVMKLGNAPQSTAVSVNGLRL